MTMKEYIINGNRYIKNDGIKIQIPEYDENQKIVGWLLETRFKHQGIFTIWQRYRNKLYYSNDDAIQAAIKISKTSFYSDKDDFEWRTYPLFKMNNSQWREYQIDELLKVNTENGNENESKFWKVLEDYKFYNQTVKKGDIIVKFGNSFIKLATPTEKTFYFSKYSYENIKKQEIKLNDINNLYPHFTKQLKNNLN